MALTLSPSPIVMIPCIFSHQAPVSEAQDFVKLLHPYLCSCVAPLQHHQTQIRFFLLFHSFELSLMACSFHFVFQRPWDTCQLLELSIPPALPSACCSHEGNEECICHFAIQLYSRKHRLLLKVHSLLMQAFLLTASSVVFTLCILLKFWLLTFCLCPLLQESPGLCKCNRLEIIYSFPGETYRFSFF